MEGIFTRTEFLRFKTLQRGHLATTNLHPIHFFPLRGERGGVGPLVEFSTIFFKPSRSDINKKMLLMFEAVVWI